MTESHYYVLVGNQCSLLKNNITKSEDTRKNKFLHKSVTFEALACTQFYLNEIMHH